MQDVVVVQPCVRGSGISCAGSFLDLPAGLGRILAASVHWSARHLGEVWRRAWNERIAIMQPETDHEKNERIEEKERRSECDEWSGWSPVEIT
jgi:hypothetical protein